jgi:hypothetical protein
MPASMKLGRGGGKGGSTHLSKKVLGFSGISAVVFFGSAAAFEGAGTKGLENRDLVGLEVGVDIVAAAATSCDHLPFFCDRESSSRVQRIWRVVSSGTSHRNAEFNTSLSVKCMHTGQDRDSGWWDALYFW